MCIKKNKIKKSIYRDLEFGHDNTLHELSNLLAATIHHHTYQRGVWDDNDKGERGRVKERVRLFESYIQLPFAIAHQFSHLIAAMHTVRGVPRHLTVFYLSLSLSFSQHNLYRDRRVKYTLRILCALRRIYVSRKREHSGVCIFLSQSRFVRALAIINRMANWGHHLRFQFFAPLPPPPMTIIPEPSQLTLCSRNRPSSATLPPFAPPHHYHPSCIPSFSFMSLYYAHTFIQLYSSKQKRTL